MSGLPRNVTVTVLGCALDTCADAVLARGNVTASDGFSVDFQEEHDVSMVVGLDGVGGRVMLAHDGDNASGAIGAPFTPVVAFNQIGNAQEGARRAHFMRRRPRVRAAPVRRGRDCGRALVARSQSLAA